MAPISSFEFARTVQDACDHAHLVTAYDVQILDDVVVKIQIVLTSEAFISVFYNAETGKCSYALIEKGSRVFGADNAFIGWHIHPFEDPSEHQPSSEIAFEDFLRIIEEHVSASTE